MASRDLVVRFIGDDRQLSRTFAASERRAKQFEGRMGKVGQTTRGIFAGTGFNKGALLFGSGAFIGSAVASRAIQTSINAASDLNEQLSKSNVVFGKNAKEVEDWSRTLATSFGISERAGLSAAATFGSIFTNTGSTTQKASEMSRTLVELAGDLASFNNASVDEALLALRSGLSGEIEPLRRFQVFLTEATVAQRAMADTGKANARQLTQGEKILARYSLILEQTQQQQGDFARTSGSLANQQRELAAQIDNAAASIGSVLLPAATALVTAFNDAFEAGGDLKRVLGELAGLPGIEIPVKLVSNVTGGGRGESILRHIVLGGISPLALGITIGKEIADGIGIGADSATTSLPTGPQRGAGGRAAARAAVAAAAAAAAASAKAGQAAIDRIERAAREKSLRQQLADSEKRAAHLRDLIRADSDNVKLQQRLRAELDKQASIRRQIAAKAQSAAAADKAAAAAAKSAADEAKRRAKEVAQAQAEAARTRKQAAQFKALGLTADGQQRVPGIGSLRARARTLLEQIKGTPLAGKFGKRLGAVLGKQFDDAGREVRQTILDMFNTIASAFQQGARRLDGPLTRTSSLNAAKIVEGLGLSPAEERALRARLSHFNSAGQRLSGAGTSTTGSFRTGVVIENNVTVAIDGQKVTATVTKQQQRAKRQNPRQKRGQHKN